MKAIETAWRGFRFRSRLEARWAVFFDSMGIEAWYEPEAFQFADGVRYLPDFFLPRIGWYAEVKPTRLSQAEMHKANRLCEESGKDLILLVGPPDFKDYPWMWAHMNGDEVPQYTNLADVSLDIHDGNEYYFTENRLFTSPCRIPPIDPNHFSLRYQAAVYLSRGERFQGGNQ